LRETKRQKGKKDARAFKKKEAKRGLFKNIIIIIYKINNNNLSSSSSS